MTSCMKYYSSVRDNQLVYKSNGIFRISGRTPPLKNLSKIMCFRTFQITFLRYLGFSKNHNRGTSSKE